jgi:exonuclease VII small subunit
LKFISDSPGAIKQRRVINEVVEILESGKVDIIDALVKNVREFKRAVDMSKRLFVCEDELIILKKEIADMRGELDRLTARPDGSDPQDAGSEKEII